VNKNKPMVLVETENGWKSTARTQTKAQRSCPDGLFLEVGSAGLASAALGFSVRRPKIELTTEKAGPGSFLK